MIPSSRLALALALSLAPAAHGALDLQGLDRNVDACTDFYRYANGRWLATAAIPGDRSRWTAFDAIDERNEMLLREVLGAVVAKRPAEGTAARKAADFYASGMDVAAIGKAGLAPLAGPLALASQVADVQGLSAALSTLRRSGLGIGFTFNVTHDPKQADTYLVHISPGGLGLPDRDYYFKDDDVSKRHREAYGRFIAQVLELAGDTAALAASRATAIVAVETELAKATLTAAERRDVERTYNKMAVERLAEIAPGFPWAVHLEALGARGVREVNVTQPAFATTFARLAASRPAADWQAYLRWHVLRLSAAQLHAPFADADFAFNEGILRGVKSQPDRHRKVLLVITGNRGSEPIAEAVGQLFVERAFPPEAKARMNTMIGHVKGALAERLATLEWMGPETRAKALEKLSAMGVKVGYPDKWRDYADARIGGERIFVENWLEANAFQHRRLIARLGRPVDRQEWFASPHIVNAFYSSRQNEIVFPAGILQPPFFDAKADPALNYGGIGMVIGHEITHGFDDNGRRSDAKGNQRDWWTEEDAKRYTERARRVEAQYGAYQGVDGVNVNGKLTLGENLSDIGGVKIAYLALQRELGPGPRAKIDGYTPEQRFFLNFAQSWRSLYRPERERQLLLTDSHSPPRYRVQGSVSNLPEFARAFACDPKKALRAENERADLW